MKAIELLQRYAAEERNFRGANLQGQSFKGKDLSGADFSEADIRGANFTNATLKNANFTGAQAGLQKRLLIDQLLASFQISALLNFLSVYINVAVVTYLFDPALVKDFGYIPGIFLLLAIGITFFAIARQGLTSEAVTTIAYAGAVAGAVSVVFAGAVSVVFAGAVAGAGAVSVVFAGALAVVFAGAVSVALAGALAGAVAVAFAGAGAGALAGAVAVAGAGALAGAVAVAGAGAVAVATVILSAYVAWRTSKGDEKFALARRASIAIGALGGTSFRGADLTDANFKNAILKNTNFNRAEQQQTILTQVCWQGAKGLDRARVDDSILKNPAVRELLVTRDGHGKSYIEASFQGANLDGVDLESADLKRADLSDATLKDANLKNANFTEALVLRTDFTGAQMTGACLEAWNIDSTTKLDQVDCQYVYLRNEKEERRPSSGDFAPGEFTKLFQEVLSTVDLIFRDGIDWKAFKYSFDKLVLDNQGTELSIQSIENKGDGVVVVRVNAPPNADKAKIHSEFNQTYAVELKALEAHYQAQLEGKNEQITIYREHNANLQETIKSLANRPVNFEVKAIAESKSMNNSNENNRTVNIGGDVTGSTINLGEISGNVSNVINQLPSSSDPNQPGIKERLTELQKAIEEESQLKPEDKADLLEQVKALAEAKQTSDPEKKGKLVRYAKKIFEATLAGLPTTATLAEACSKLLPIILKLLGFPVPG